MVIECHFHTRKVEQPDKLSYVEYGQVNKNDGLERLADTT